MRITCDPPIHEWRLSTTRPTDRAAVSASGRKVHSTPEAHCPPAITPPAIPTGPIIATGHQAWLWHPGILAKFLASVLAARHLRAQPIYLVVDHDEHDALQLALPVKRDDRLEVHHTHLSKHPTHVPTGCQKAVEAEQVIQTLTRTQQQLSDVLQVNLQPLIDAFGSVSGHKSLADQVSAVLAALMQPYTGRIIRMFSSSFDQTDKFTDLVDHMLHDAQQCAVCHNRAAKEHVEAGITLLAIRPNRVELPLWLLRWDQPRQRVFADLSGSKPMLVLSRGEPLDRIGPETGRRLAPRAVLLSAFMRNWYCDLFVHGLGGATYDRVTEQWWSDWLGQELAPKAVVSADLHLDFDVPVAKRADGEHAVWWAHHLPHNIDRALDLDGPLVRKKRRLLAQMNADRDRRRRASAFQEIHQINRELAGMHPQQLSQARRAVDGAIVGAKNHDVAHKRDWCFAFYAPGKIRQLGDQFASLGRNHSRRRPDSSQ